ncbi:MAG: fumarate reductase subunit C [Planctomycetes bacterium]|nr:fumarate reductase subunit C [Planctomycetota bacterium]
MPKPYVRKMAAGWWLKKRAYFYFMLRELTVVFIAAYCVLLLVMLWLLKQGPYEFDTLLDHFASPWAVGFHFIALVAALYHAFTWFNLAPQGIAVRLGEEKVPGVVIVASNYALWLIVSALLIWLVVVR